MNTRRTKYINANSNSPNSSSNSKSPSNSKRSLDDSKINLGCDKVPFLNQFDAKYHKDFINKTFPTVLKHLSKNAPPLHQSVSKSSSKSVSKSVSKSLKSSKSISKSVSKSVSKSTNHSSPQKTCNQYKTKWFTKYDNPYHISCSLMKELPLLKTVPPTGQFVFGRVQDLSTQCYYEKSSKSNMILLLNDNWTIKQNDLFVYCSVVNIPPTLRGTYFPIRIVSSLAALALRNITNINWDKYTKLYQNVLRKDEDLNETLVRNHTWARLNEAYPTVTTREICQLMKLFKLDMYQSIKYPHLLFMRPPVSNDYPEPDNKQFVKISNDVAIGVLNVIRLHFNYPSPLQVTPYQSPNHYQSFNQSPNHYQSFNQSPNRQTNQSPNRQTN